MMSLRLKVTQLATAIAAALVIGSCGSNTPGSPGGASKSTAPHVVANATLGSAKFLPGYFHSKGYGSPHPPVIYNGGDPAGLISRIRWRNWGASMATGEGLGSAYKPQGGYYHRAVVVKLRAERLGDCDGRPGYHWLFVRKQRRPHGEFFPWHLWWGPHHADLCGHAFSKSAAR